MHSKATEIAIGDQKLGAQNDLAKSAKTKQMSSICDCL